MIINAAFYTFASRFHPAFPTRVLIDATGWNVINLFGGIHEISRIVYVTCK